MCLPPVFFMDWARSPERLWNMRTLFMRWICWAVPAICAIGSICCLCKADGTEENWSYQLNAAEREVLARKMDAFCQEQTSMSLRVYAQQFREEPEQRQGPVMKL